jgi:dTDP-4-amino-4,6-dideoxygalactose transaminase
MTLDSDDVALARECLENRECWEDFGIVRRYQEAFAVWNGSKYAYSFMSGRVALSACLEALELAPGDEVIIPGYTCVVVLNALDYAGVTAIFSDIELDTYGLDAAQLESKINGKTRAILLHHLYGLVCRDYEAILALARRYGLRVIEDCAHATGATFNGMKVGNRGDLAIYSTEQSKVFTTVQGGIATANDDLLAERLRAYHDSAPYPEDDVIEKLLYNVMLNYYQHKHPWRWCLGIATECIWGRKRLISTTRAEERGEKPEGYGAKMPAPIAALGLNQLKKVDQYNELRRVTAHRWDAWCERHGYALPLIVPGSVPVFLRYPVLVEEEKKRSPKWALRSEKVMPGVWFLTHAHPAQRDVTRCPNADIAVKRCINFPCIIG